MRLAVILFISAFVLCFTASVYAADLQEPVHKLYGGVESVVKSPLELGHYTIEETKGADFKPYGLVFGLFKGSGYMVQKAGHGALDIATFPLKLHD